MSGRDGNRSTSSAQAGRQFLAGPAMAGLSRRSLRGGSVMLASHTGQLFVNIGATMVLARMLRPQDFGVVAMAWVLTQLVETFRCFSLPAAIVQSKEIDDEQCSALFWKNTQWSALVATFMIAMAPVLVWFFDEPVLLPIVGCMSVGVLVRSSATLHVGLLRRQMRFGTLSLLALGSQSCGAIAGIVSALLGAGLWALVIQRFVASLVQTGAFWAACPWRPTWRPRTSKRTRANTRAALSFGGQVTLTRVLGHLGKHFDRVLIGRLGGAATLGLYEIAHRWAALPLVQLFGPLNAVAVSSLSRLQEDPSGYRTHARNTLLAFFSLVLPALVLVFVQSRDVVLLLLGGQWLGAVDLMEILLVAAFFHSALMATSWVYLSEGRSRRMLSWSMIQTPVLAASVAMGTVWGTKGVAVCYSGAIGTLTLGGVLFCLKDSPLSLRDYGLPWLAAALFALVPGAVVWAARPLIADLGSLGWRLAIGTGMYCAGYALIWLALPPTRHKLRQLVASFR